jgi:hypothetical protein
MIRQLDHKESLSPEYSEEEEEGEEDSVEDSEEENCLLSKQTWYQVRIATPFIVIDSDPDNKALCAPWLLTLDVIVEAGEVTRAHQGVLACLLQSDGHTAFGEHAQPTIACLLRGRVQEGVRTEPGLDFEAKAAGLISIHLHFKASQGQCDKMLILFLSPDQSQGGAVNAAKCSRACPGPRASGSARGPRGSGSASAIHDLPPEAWGLRQDEGLPFICVVSGFRAELFEGLAVSWMSVQILEFC